MTNGQGIMNQALFGIWSLTESLVHQIGRLASPRDPPVSAFPGLGLQVTTIKLGFYVDLGIQVFILDVKQITG